MEELLFQIRRNCGMTYIGQDRDSQNQYSQMLHMANSISNEIRVFSGDAVSSMAAAIYLCKSAFKLAAWTTYGQYVVPPQAEDDIDERLLNHLRTSEQVSTVREIAFGGFNDFKIEWERQM